MYHQKANHGISVGTDGDQNYPLINGDPSSPLDPMTYLKVYGVYGSDPNGNYMVQNRKSDQTSQDNNNSVAVDSKLSLQVSPPAESVPRDGESQDDKTTESPNKASPGTNSGNTLDQPGTSGTDHQATNNNNEEDDEDLLVEYPSGFPGLKQHVRVTNEVVVVTRLDGVNMATGEDVSLYRCHLCSKVFNQLSKLQCHLSTHFERRMTLYQCLYCEQQFQFRVHLLRHARRIHGVSRSSLDAGDENEGEPEDDASSLEHTASSSSLPATHSSKAGQPGLASSHDGANYDFSKGEEPGDSSMMDSDVLSHESRDGKSATQGIDSRLSSLSAAEGEAKPSKTYLNTLPAFRRRALRRGLLYQRNNGMYVCRFCNKAFFRLFCLERHERVHTGYKPCFCKECGKGFSELRNLRQHRMRYHNIDDTEASIVRRIRKPFLSSLSRYSQRLTPVTPAMMVQAGIDPRSLKPNGKQSEEPEQTTETQEEQTKTMSSVEERPEQTPTPTPSEQKEQSSQLESAIKAEEHLDEDVTVVIPSDAPITNLDQNLQSSVSNNSDNASWSGNLSDQESVSSQGTEEIQSAPVRSIIGYKPGSATKSKRKLSAPVRMPSPPPQTEESVSRAESVETFENDAETENQDREATITRTESLDREPVRNRKISTDSESRPPSNMSLPLEVKMESGPMGLVSTPTTPTIPSPLFLASQVLPGLQPFYANPSLANSVLPYNLTVRAPTWMPPNKALGMNHGAGSPFQFGMWGELPSPSAIAESIANSKSRLTPVSVNHTPVSSAAHVAHAHAAHVAHAAAAQAAAAHAASSYKTSSLSRTHSR